MKIVVCIKRVPDTATNVRIGEDGRSLDPGGVKYVTNPYDEYALEAALRVRESTGGGEVIVLTLGDDASGETLRSALALGADRAIHVRGETSLDGLATAKVLAAEIETIDPELILVGVKAVDGDQQQVGPMIATILGRGCATAVAELRLEGDEIICEAEVEGGRVTVALARGSVVTITKGAYEPRYASLKGIMAAKKKSLDVKPAIEVPVRIRLDRLEPPAGRAAGRIVGEGPDGAVELARILREEAGLI